MPEFSTVEPKVVSNIHVDHGQASCPNTTSIMSADCWKMEEREGENSGSKQNNRKSTTARHRAIAHDRRSQFSLPSMTSTRTSHSTWGFFFILFASLWVNPASAVFITFTNCLSESYQRDQPIQLQFVPYFFDAAFNTTDPSHNLAVRVWGNVEGSGPGAQLVVPPGSNDTAYWNSNSTATNNGKIVDIPDQDLQLLTTLSNKVTVLTYEPYSKYVDFCDQLVNASCPLGPNFNATG
jgi:hypothetical protein